MFRRFNTSRLADDEKSKAFSKVLGEAIGFDISEQALKVKKSAARCFNCSFVNGGRRNIGR